jgi:hypothetical protein
MISELDRVVLTADLPEYNLKPGDIGTVVLVHQEGLGYEVEFITIAGIGSGIFRRTRPVAIVCATAPFARQ